MDFRQHIRPGKIKFNFIPFINVFFIISGLIIFSIFLSKNTFISVGVPRGVTSDVAAAVNMTIVVTSENIMYVNNKLITLGELKNLFRSSGNNYRAVLIKADHRASVGCVVDILNLGRNMGIEHINIATDRED